MFVGLDACRAGWVGVEQRERAPRLFPRFADALAAWPRATVAVDTPIGLMDEGSGDRACDKLARAALGPRRSSVFVPPLRKHLRARSRPAGVSAQAWGIAPRIREVDDAMTRGLQRRVVEAHPELAFAALAGAPMRHPKRTAAGARERVRALGLRRAPPVPTGARLDDVLDAWALAHEARRIALGVAQRYPERPPRDARGLRMEIWG